MRHLIGLATLLLCGCLPQGADLDPPEMVVRMKTGAAPGADRIVLSTYRATPGIASVCAGGAIPDALRDSDIPIVLMPPRQGKVGLIVTYADLGGVGYSDLSFALDEASGVAEDVVPGADTPGLFRMPDFGGDQSIRRELIVTPKVKGGVSIRLEATDLPENSRQITFKLARHSDFCE